MKKTRSTLRRELVQSAEREVDIDPKNLSGDDGGDGDEVLHISFFMFELRFIFGRIVFVEMYVNYLFAYQDGVSLK
jgi:hypothetical protein